MNTFKNTLRNQAGSSMIEVLVTLIILLVGLLGLAGLQVQAQRSEIESYQRVQALVLLQDMVGRINANRGNAASYVVNNIGTGDAQPAASACPSQTTLTARDLCEWSNALKGASELQGTNAVGAMVGALGCITYASNIAMVSVVWQGLDDTVAPSVGLTCGQGLYGAETKRRVVSTPIRFGCLTC